MIPRLLTCVLILVGLTGCWEEPYKKRDEEEHKMRDQSSDQNFMSFVGRLRIAVSRHDTAMLSSLMTSDFGYRWDDGPPGETPFMYWDQHKLWGQLSSILDQKFGVLERYMVAPPQAINDPTYTGYRVGARVVRGSWKLAYFVPAEPTGATPPQ